MVKFGKITNRQKLSTLFSWYLFVCFFTGSIYTFLLTMLQSNTVLIYFRFAKYNKWCEVERYAKRCSAAHPLWQNPIFYSWKKKMGLSSRQTKEQEFYWKKQKEIRRNSIHIIWLFFIIEHDWTLTTLYLEISNPLHIANDC